MTNNIDHDRLFKELMLSFEQWNSAYYTPMQENNCLNLPQMSN